jgi:hypothetical protein
MPYISESSKRISKKSFSCVQWKILCRFQLREVGSYVSVRTAKSYVQTPISIEKPNSSKLHLSRRHGNMSGRSSGFEKIPIFIHIHKVRRQVAPVQTPGQHRPNAEILDKEITCILNLDPLIYIC